MRSTWQDARLHPHRDEDVWELFHENSKVSLYEEVMPPELAAEFANEMHRSLDYGGAPHLDLPIASSSIGMDVGEAISMRATPGRLWSRQVSPDQLSALLAYSYGVRGAREVSEGAAQRRHVPSGGALYPLEIYLYAAEVRGLAKGLYHYHSGQHRVALVKPGDLSQEFSAALIRPELVAEASILIVIAGLFERSIIKYGNRGYRAVLLEAGHVGQNLALVATGLGLGCVNLLGYRDRCLDRIVGLDGLDASVVYLAAIGGSDDPNL